MEENQPTRRPWAWAALGAVAIILLVAALTVQQSRDDRAAPIASQEPLPEEVAATLEDAAADGSTVPQVPDGNVPDVVRTANAAGYFPGYHREDFIDCHEHEGRRAGITTYAICNAQALPACPFANNGRCSAAADFVNEALRHVSFDYAYSNADEDRLRKSLEKQFGASPTEHKRLDFPQIESWITRWDHDQVSVTLMRSRGVNIYEESYDSLSVMFSDNALPDPLEFE